MAEVVVAQRASPEEQLATEASVKTAGLSPEQAKDDASQVSLLAPEVPDVSHLITEDDTPVDNIPSAKQQRLLVEPLYSSWRPGRPFLADANVGLFSSIHQPAIVPDMFLSLDVEVAEDWWAKEHRSYFLWEFGKAPDVVVEIVSNTRGGEDDKKLRDYARMGIPYYVIYDPQRPIQDDVLIVYQLVAGEYIVKPDSRLEKVGLELRLWEGEFEARHDRWLRWYDNEGNLIPTGAERAEQERERAERERRRAEQERERAERLAAQLRALGVEPEV